MALTIAGAQVAIGPLLSGCYSIVKGITQLHQSYKFMPLTLSSIVATCNMTRVILNRLESVLAKRRHDAFKTSDEELFEQFDGIKMGCTLTLSLLEENVKKLISVVSSDVPLQAQKISIKDKLKALYNESDMKEILSQLKDHNTLLATMLSLVQSDKHDKMMNMLVTQERTQRTLQNMLRARELCQKRLQDTDALFASDMVSNLSSNTNMTALTAFDFDSLIKGTAIYQRCMRRHGDKSSFLSLDPSFIQTPEPSTRDMATEAEPISDAEAPTREETTEGGAKSQEAHESGHREKNSKASARSKASDKETSPNPRISESDSGSQSDNNVSDPVYVPLMRLSDNPEHARHVSSHDRATHPSGIKKSLAAHKIPRKAVPDGARSTSHESIKQNIVRDQLRRQSRMPVEHNPDMGQSKEHRRRSSHSVQEGGLTSIIGTSKLPSRTFAKLPSASGSSPRGNMNDTDLIQKVDDIVPRLILPETHPSRRERRRSSQGAHTDHELARRQSKNLRADSKQHNTSTSTADSIQTGATVDKTPPSNGLDTVACSQLDAASTKISESETSDDMIRQTSTRLQYDKQGRIYNMAISSKSVLAVALIGMIRLWDLNTGKEVVKIPCSYCAYTEAGVAFSSDGTMLATVNFLPRESDTTISVWDAETGVRLCGIHIHNEFMTLIDLIVFSADNKLIACYQQENFKHTVMVYRIDNGGSTGPGIRLQRPTGMLSFIRKDRQLLSCRWNRVEFWDVATSTLTQVYESGCGGLTHPIVTHDLMLINSNSFGQLYMIDLKSGVKKAFVELSGDIYRLTYVPGTKEIAFSGWKGSIGTWNPWTGSVKQPPGDHKNVAKRAAVSLDGRTIFWGDPSGMLMSWT